MISKIYLILVLVSALANFKDIGKCTIIPIRQETSHITLSGENEHTSTNIFSLSNGEGNYSHTDSTENYSHVDSTENGTVIDFGDPFPPSLIMNHEISSIEEDSVEDFSIYPEDSLPTSNTTTFTKGDVKGASVPTAISQQQPTAAAIQDPYNFSILFSGEFKNISVKIKMSGDKEMPGVSLEIPGTENTEDNCYIISLLSETPHEILEMLSFYLEKYVSASAIFLYQHVFKGCHFCFPKDFESKISLDMVRQIPWISFIEHDSVISIARSVSHFDILRVDEETDNQIYVQQNAPWGLTRISQPKRPLNNFCYEYSSNGTGVNIYVIDSGIDLNHSEFDKRAQLVFVGPSLRLQNRMNDNEPIDCSGHGTEVASVAAGKICGVAKGANILALKVLSCNGQGRNSDLITALEWVATNYKAPGVINLSLGGPSSATLDMAIEAVITRGIPVVVAAGNDGINACECSPARLSLSITVGASMESNERADFSNYGKCVKIFAPGHMIQVARASSTNQYGGELVSKKSFSRTSEFVFSSGTSLAAPAVAGVAALILERHPTITTSKLWALIRTISQKDSLSLSSLKGSPNLLLQSPPSTKIDLMSLDLIDDDEFFDAELSDSGKTNADSFGISPFTWSWILISALMTLGVFGVFALIVGAKAIKNASFKRSHSYSTTSFPISSQNDLNHVRGRTLY